MRFIIYPLALLLLSAGANAQGVPAAGRYELEKTHASLIWRVSHMGLSQYTARFTDFDAVLDFDPRRPERSRITATINPVSVRTDHPTEAEKWERDLAYDWFDAGAFPRIEFKSTSVKQTGENRGEITGKLNLLGVSKNIVLDVVYNGSQRLPWFGDRDSIGFSARATIARSEFGMTKMLPRIGDEVEIIIEAEFVGQADARKSGVRK